MNKNKFAVTPPMGWNSYDYYDTTVNEKQVKANADYMAKYLRPYGWEYIVVDIEWYSYGAGSRREEHMSEADITELWLDKRYQELTDCIPAHGARLYQMEII